MCISLEHPERLHVTLYTKCSVQENQGTEYRKCCRNTIYTAITHVQVIKKSNL